MSLDMTSASSRTGTRPSTRSTPLVRRLPAVKKESRAELLRAAKTLFAREGFDGVSVKEIADAAGVNVGLIAYYFGSKQGIYRECLTADGEQRLAAAKRLLINPQSLLEFELRLKIFSEEVLDSHLRDPEVTTLVHRECEQGRHGSPEVEAVFRKTYFAVFRTLQNFIATGIRKGFLRANLDPEIAALFFFGQLIHATRMDAANSRYFGKTVSNPEFRKLYITQLVDLFVAGSANAASRETGKNTSLEKGARP